LKDKDHLLVITTSENDVDALTMLFGEHEAKDWNKKDIDWNAIDSQLISQRIVVTRPEINGKKLSSLRLRNHYGINISRVYRSGVQLLATPDLVLQMGDRLTVVGEAAAIQNVESVLGNAVKSLSEPNLVAVFVGIVLGLAAVIIGINLFKNFGFVKGTTAAMIGAIIYKACYAGAIKLGMSATDMKLITAVLFLAVLLISTGKKKGGKRHA